MKRYLLAAVASVMLVGFVVADEFPLQITSINADGSVTGNKFGAVKDGKGGGKFKLKEVTVKLARDVRVHKGKLEDGRRYAADGDDLKLAGLKAAVLQAQNGSVVVDGKAIGAKDTLELSMHDGKPAAKLNGKDVPFAAVKFRRKGPLATRVTTSDDGVVTTILIIPPGTGTISAADKFFKENADK